MGSLKKLALGIATFVAIASPLAASAAPYYAPYAPVRNVGVWLYHHPRAVNAIRSTVFGARCYYGLPTAYPCY